MIFRHRVHFTEKKKLSCVQTKKKKKKKQSSPSRNLMTKTEQEIWLTIEKLELTTERIDFLRFKEELNRAISEIICNQ